MVLDLSGGKSIPQAYEDWYISALIASRKWRRDLIKHWRDNSSNSIRIIDGKEYWGGTIDIRNPLSNPTKEKTLRLLGVDDAGIQDIQDIDGEDWVYAQFRVTPKTDTPYSVENVAFVMEHGVAPKAVQSGLSTVVFKGNDIVVPCKWYTRTVIKTDGTVVSDTTAYSLSYLEDSSTTTTEGTTTTTITTGLDNYINHAPTPSFMKGMSRTDNAYNPNFSATNTFYAVEEDPVLGVYAKNGLGASGLGDVFASIYACTNFFETYVTNTKVSKYIKTNYDFLGIRPVSWVFRTEHTFVMGDYGWMNNNSVSNVLYPAIVIGASKETDYFTFFNTNGFKTRSVTVDVAKNLSGRIMDIMDYDTSGNGLLNDILLSVISPYSWAISDSKRLWFELDHVMSMDVKEFMMLISKHLDIQAGADSGFWGTFVGGFIGAVIGLVSVVLDVFFKVVELLDFIMKPTINLMLKYVFNVNDSDREKIMDAYTEIRNTIALIVVTLGIGAYLEGASIAAEASAAMVEGGGAALTAAETEMVIMGSIEASFASIGTTQLVNYGIQVAGAAYSGFSSVADAAAPMAAQAVEESTRAVNPMQMIYGDVEIDFVDAVYVMMDDLGMGDLGNDVIGAVYG